MKYDVIIIGAGLSGLTAASLLAKRGLKVAAADKSNHPGGSCGIFKRDNAIFDQGAAMLYGFGEKGFNAHRFVFNCLEEPINIIKHDLLYCVNFKGNRIKFWNDVDMFADELSLIFPSEKNSIKKFYSDLVKLYNNVMVENPNYTTADETEPKKALISLLKHPVSYAVFLSYLNKSAKSLLEKYFTDPEIFKFFDKLTSTYCYATVEESPAILAAVMFVDNHIGGSYYPAGSTIFLPGKLEKIIEENNGDMYPGNEVIKILFEDDTPAGAEFKNGEKIYADNIIYSGTVWNLYNKLIDKSHTDPKRMQWAEAQVPTYSSVVYYACVDKKVIPDDTCPVEMLIGNPDRIDESEITVYIFSIDDRTLCDDDCHVLAAIGPSFENWDTYRSPEYLRQKVKEEKRIIESLDKRFKGFSASIRYSELATPLTIERYTNKTAVAGPKQMLGQHMFNRLHTKSEWKTLFCCGESTVMGTGTPTVTTSGLSAANAVLKKLGLEPYVYKENMKNYVNIIKKPFVKENLYSEYPEEERKIMLKAYYCLYCEHPSCSANIKLDVRGIMRRVTVGNFMGAKKLVENFTVTNGSDHFSLTECENKCIQKTKTGIPVEIQAVFNYITHC